MIETIDLKQPPVNPAFPGVVPFVGGYEGMTLRDYFAAHAPVQLLHPRVFEGIVDKEQDAVVMERAAERVYEWADAMLVARNKESR